MSLYETTLYRIIRPTTLHTWSALLQFPIYQPYRFLPVSAVNFGIQFQLDYDNLWNNPQIERDALTDTKDKCRNLLIELLKDMKKRLPSNVSRLESLSKLAPSAVLQKNKVQLQKLSFISLFDGDLGKLDTQWQMIGTVQWKDANDLSTEEFLDSSLAVQGRG